MDAYDELYAYTIGRKNFILQHVVDANIAQRAPAANPPPIGVIFSLAGLYLHVDKGFTGTQVQKAHRVMGKVKRSWPGVVWPSQRAPPQGRFEQSARQERPRPKPPFR
jgi:hypothetical protein